MMRLLKPDFGSRQRRPRPAGTLGDPLAKQWRFDWQLVTLVVVVFVASFVWLF